MSEKPYLLSVVYPDLELDGRMLRFAELAVYLGENGVHDGFGIQRQEDRRYTVALSYFPYEVSISLQAERHVWRFDKESSLTDEDLPALSDQSEDQERCRGVISGMDLCPGQTE